MQMLHEGHCGMIGMKAIVRVVWWPGINAEIERKIKEFPECQNAPEILTHGSPKAGLFEDRMFLVVVDSHSKWLDVIYHYL